MPVLSGSFGVGYWLAAKARPAMQLLRRCTVDAAARLFGGDQVYRQIFQAETLRREVDVLSWTLIMRGDGTALAEHRLTGKTLELTADDAASILEAAAPAARPPA